MVYAALIGASAVVVVHQTFWIYRGMIRYYHDGDSTSVSYNRYPPQENTWRWRDWHFTLGKYEYDDFMDLTIERLKGEPITNIEVKKQL